MTVLEALLLLVVAGVCGGLGQTLGGFSRGGFLVSIVLGFIGASIARSLELPRLIPLEVGDREFPIIWSVIGSALFVVALGFISRVAKKAA